MFDIRLILQGDVKKRLDGYFKKPDICKLPKLYSDFVCEQNSYLDLHASTIGYEIPGSVVVYKMLAVKQAIKFLKDAFAIRLSLKCIFYGSLQCILAVILKGI